MSAMHAGLCRCGLIMVWLTEGICRAIAFVLLLPLAIPSIAILAIGVLMVLTVLLVVSVAIFVSATIQIGMDCMRYLWASCMEALS